MTIHQIIRKTGRRVRQVFGLPLLFNIVSHVIYKAALVDMKVGINVYGKPINTLRYADETIILANRIETIPEQTIHRCKTYGSKCQHQ